MRPFAAVILVLCYAALGSGAAESLHNAQHATEDARHLAESQNSGQTPQYPTHHDDNNCPVHLQLHLSVMAVGWVPLLICLGLFVAFLTELPVSLPAQQRRLILPCRGPPVC